MWGRKLLIILGLFVMVLVMACGVAVEVPTAHVGKINTDAGLQEDVLPPSKFKLETWCRSCDSLILVEASDYPAGEKMKVFMPKDNLNLTLEVRGTFTIEPNEANVTKVFNRIPATKIEGFSNRVSLITIDRVYLVYAQNIIKAAVRSVVTKYTIEHVMSNRESVSQELILEVARRLAATPIKPIQFELADLQPPDVVVEAQIRRKEREVQVDQAKAQKLINITIAEGNLEVAKKNQLVELTEAETQRLVNIKLADSVSPAFVAQKYLRFLQTAAENDNKTLIIPFEALDTVGGSLRVFQFDVEQENK